MVQPLWSASQGLPLARSGKLQTPVLASQPSVVQLLPSTQLACTLLQPVLASHVSNVQALLSSHCSALVALHAPPWQAELLVHTVPSSHALPSTTGLGWQAPVPGLQTCVAHGASPGRQNTTDAAFALHAGFFGSVLSQYGTPLHRSPSSLLRQSLLVWHSQVLAPGLH